MPDQLDRFKQLLSSLQESILLVRHREGRKLQTITEWLDEHQADVREFCELKGNDMVDHFLGFPRGFITQWRRDRDFTEPPEEAREKEAARQQQVQACFLRLKEDQASLQGMQPGRWLDRHQEDVEIILSSGTAIMKFADLFDITRPTMSSWAKRRSVPQPLEEDRTVATPQDTATNGDAWQKLSAPELRKVLAQDINSMGMKEASKLWRSRGLSYHRWGVQIRWIRQEGLIDESAEGDRPSDEYYEAKYEGMKEALEIIFGQGRAREDR